MSSTTTITNIGIQPVRIPYTGDPGELVLEAGGRVQAETARLNLKHLESLAQRKLIVYSKQAVSSGGIGSSGPVAIPPSITATMSVSNIGGQTVKLLYNSTTNGSNLTNWQANGSTCSFIRADGSIGLPTLADSAAVNNSLYYSSTTSKLTYKDGSGTLHAV